jgi:glycosyltransferase involved in cell wall biosynthesis
MNVLHIANSRSQGGAGIATGRILDALHSALAQRYLIADEVTVGNGVFDAFRGRLSRQIEHRLSLIHSRRSGAPFTSYGLGGPFSARDLRQGGISVIHLHWTARGTIATSVLKRCKQPLVWTLHDLWAALPTQHYPPQDRRKTDANGLLQVLASRAMRAKVEIAESGTLYVAPGDWTKRTFQSLMPEGADNVRVIPYPASEDFLTSEDQLAARARLDLDSREPIVLFADLDGKENHRKGWDLLESALQSMSTPCSVLLVGSSKGPASVGNARIRSIGRQDSPAAMRTLYAAANVTVVPTRADTVNLVAQESLLTGTPVITFANTGTADLLAEIEPDLCVPTGDTQALRHKLQVLLNNPHRSREIGQRARSKGLLLWAPHRIARMYQEVYAEAHSTRRPETRN